MKVLNCVVLISALLCPLIGCRKAALPDFVTSDDKNAMETNSCFPRYGKGGVGIVSTDLYVFTKSKWNEIDWGEGENAKKWTGRSASQAEVVVFFDDKIWPLQSLPHAFDKSKSVVISFEKEHIRFYDYVHKGRCNYERDPEY